MAWNTTKAVGLYAVIIWLLYKGQPEGSGGRYNPEWVPQFKFGTGGKGMTAGSPIDISGGGTGMY